MIHKPYTMSKFMNKQDCINSIMAATDLSEPERMEYIWNSLTPGQQEAIKDISDYMYYCILATVNSAKIERSKS